MDEVITPQLKAVYGTQAAAAFAFAIGMAPAQLADPHGAIFLHQKQKDPADALS